MTPLKQQKIDKELRDKLKEMRAQGETEAKIKNGKIVKKHGKPSGYCSVPTNVNNHQTVSGCY